MAAQTYRFTETMRLYPGVHSTWHYISVPAAESADIYTTYRAVARGFGSLPVTVTLGESQWCTSIFRDARAGRYLLFIKKAIRTAEGLMVGDAVSVELSFDSKVAV